jgi:two-component system, OmpR family, phosphate regulon response regulator PhoB
MKQILLIEYDSDVRDVITCILEDQDLMVLSVAVPFEPESAMDFHPDLILIDEWASGKAGHPLCHQIKQMQQFSQVPVIIISTANNIENITTDCGADDFISKPFDMNELVEKVQQQLARLSKP